VARIPGCDKEWRELYTRHQKGAGTKGREVPVLMSQMSVVVVPGRGTAESWSEGNGWDFQFLSSGLLC